MPATKPVKNPTLSPSLKLKLKTELAEGKDHYRTVAFDFGISAAPFFGLDVNVDILPVLAKPLDGGIISKWLLEEAQSSLKKGIGNEDGLYSLKGEVSVIMKGSGKLACEARFKGDFSNNSNRIEKISGKPVEGKIEFSAEGKVDVKGHLFKVKVELVAGIGIKSGITLGLEIDSDDAGYYWQPNAKFNGVKVYITKYVKVKKDAGGGDSSGRFGAAEPNLTANPNAILNQQITATRETLPVQANYPRWAWQDGQIIEDTPESNDSLLAAYREIYDAYKNKDRKKLLELHDHAADEFAIAFYLKGGRAAGHALMEIGEMLDDTDSQLSDFHTDGSKLDIYANGRMARIIDAAQYHSFVFLHKTANIVYIIMKFGFYKNNAGEWVMIR